MPKTTNLNLELTTDVSTLFEAWRKSINFDGVGAEKSNMQLIDDAFGDLEVSGTGAAEEPSYTNNGGGNITVHSIIVKLYATADYTGSVHKFTIPVKSFDLVDGATNYIVADYNAGVPEFRLTTIVSEITESSIVPIYTIQRNGIYLHVTNWDSLGNGKVDKLHQSIIKTQRYRRESGLGITTNASRNITIAEGKVWYGAYGITLEELSTDVDNMFLYYHVAGVWTLAVETAFRNTQYDNGTNLATLSNGRYAVIWLFRGVEEQKHLYCVLGRGDYTQAQALASTVPTIPQIISSHAVLIGRLLVVKSATTPYLIQSAFETAFSSTPANSHADLTDLQGGVAGEYYHLTSAELVQVQAIGDLEAAITAILGA